MVPVFTVSRSRLTSRDFDFGKSRKVRNWIPFGSEDQSGLVRVNGQGPKGPAIYRRGVTINSANKTRITYVTNRPGTSYE